MAPARVVAHSSPHARRRPGRACGSFDVSVAMCKPMTCNLAEVPSTPSFRFRVEIYERWQYHHDVVLEVQVHTPLEIYSCSPSFSGEATFVKRTACG